jgi:hypothetical protein
MFRTTRVQCRSVPSGAPTLRASISLIPNLCQFAESDSLNVIIGLVNLAPFNTVN